MRTYAEAEKDGDVKKIEERKKKEMLRMFQYVKPKPHGVMRPGKTAKDRKKRERK